MANDKVDTRVVRMEFDNKQFEKNVKQTTKSLDNLRESLDFKGVDDGLDKVRVKISTLQVVAATFVSRLTNKLITLGTVLVKSLSVDNISAGWSKFGEKTISVATMMAQRIRIAGEEITDLAKKTEVVNTLLEKLTWFADETSYSLSDMTNYASKFIAAGIDLDKAVNAMEGIATWAALAGQGTQKASIAMMQLSQAMGRSINRQDWMSIQNAGMDMEEFRDKVLETAVALGQLTKEGDKFVTKTGKKFEKATFTQYFSEGWFTSDVLIDTLNKYSAAVDQIYALAEEKGLTASEVIERYADQLDEFGLKAFKASQEARTFRDVLNSVKDAVTSKWMLTFENIFGNKDESIKLWTELSNRLYEVFAESGNFRNNVLSIWKSFNGRNDIFGEDGAFWNLYNAIDSIRLLINRAWNTIFPISQMEDEDARAKDIARTLKNVTSRIKEVTKNLLQSEEAVRKISKVFEILFSILKVVLFTIRSIGYALYPILYTVRQLATKFLNKIISLVGGIEGLLIKIQRAATKLRSVLWNLMDIINPSGILDKVFSFIKSTYTVIADSKPLERLRNIVTELVSSFNEAGGTQENLIKIFKGLISAVTILVNAFVALAQALNKYVLPILDKILIAGAKIIGFLSGIAVNLISIVSDIITSISGTIEGRTGISNLGDIFKNIFDGIKSAATSLKPILESLVSIFKSLIEVILILPRMLDSISVKLTGRGIIDNIKYLFDSIANTIRSFLDFIGGNDISSKSPVLNTILTGLKEFFLGIIEVLKALVIAAKSVVSALGNVFKAVGIALQKLGEVLVKLFTGRFKELTNGQKAGVIIVGILGSITLIVYMIYAAFYRLINAINPLGSIAEALSDSIYRLNFIGLTRAIDTLSNAFLKFAISLTLLEKLTGESTKVGLLLVTISRLILGIVYMIKVMTDDVELFGTTVSKSAETVKDATKDAIKKLSYYTGLRVLIESIGTLMLKIALAAYIFNKLNPAGFWRAFSVLSLVLGSLILITLTISKFSDKLQGNLESINKAPYAFKSIKTIVNSIFSILLGLAIIMKVIEGTDPDAYNRAMITFATISGVLITFVTMISVFTNSIVGKLDKNKGLMNKLSKSIPSLASLSKLLLAVSVMLVAVSLAMYTVSKSLLLLGGITGIFGGNNLEFVLLTPMISIVGVLTMLTVLLGVLSKSIKGLSDSEIIRMSGLILLLSTTLLMIGASLSMVARYNWESILSAGAALISVLALIAGITYFMMKTTTSMRNATQVSYMLLSFSVVLLSIARVLSVMASMPINDIWKYVLALSGILTVMVGLATSMQKSGSYVGLLALSTSFIMLSGALYLFGQAMKAITISSLIGGILALIGLGMAGKIAAPGLVLLGTSLKGLSTSVLILGAGLLLIAMAIDKLTGYGEKVANFIDAVTGSIVRAMQNIVLGVIELFPKMIVILIQGFGLIIGAIIDLLNTYVVPLASAVFNALIGILSVIADNIGTVVSLVGNIVMKLILGVLDVLINNISPIMDKVFELLILIIKNITANLPKLIDAIIDLAIALINTIVEIIPKIIGTIVSAITDVVIGIFNAILEIFGQQQITKEDFFTGLVDFFNIIGSLLTMILTLLKQISPVIGKIISVIFSLLDGSWFKTLVDMIVNVLTFVSRILEIIMPIVTFIVDVILNRISSLLKIIMTLLNPILEAIQNLFEILKPILEIISLISDAIVTLLSGKEFDFDKFIQQFVDLGKNLLKGLVKGFVQNIKNLFVKPFQMIGDFFKTIFGIHSPSTVFAKYGEYMIQGLGIGLDREANAEKSRFESIAKNTLKTFENALFGNDNEYDYVMTIGMDISNVEKEGAKLQDMMSSISSGTNVSATAYGYNASKLSKSIAASEKANSKVDKVIETNTDNSVNMTNNNTFNITSTDPAEAADEIDKILKKNAIRAKLAKGGI